MQNFFCEKSITKSTYVTEEIRSLAVFEFFTCNPAASINIKSNKIIITKNESLMLLRNENQQKDKTMQGYLFLVRKLRGD